MRTNGCSTEAEGLGAAHAGLAADLLGDAGVAAAIGGEPERGSAPPHVRGRWRLAWLRLGGEDRSPCRHHPAPGAGRGSG